ncbi:MAG: putative phage abortive infection protein [Ignavibacteria bacterium]
MTSSNEAIKIKEESIERRISRFWKFCIFLIVLGFAVGILGIFIFEMNGKDEFEKFGNFSAGTVASIWSLAGIVLIYIAFLGQKLELLYQKEELQLNRKELEENRKVMTEQKREFELQNKTLQKQSFENLFFQLIRNYSDIVNSMFYKSSVETSTGKDYFKSVYNELLRLKSNWDDRTAANEEERINIAFMEFYEKFEGELGNYFRNLYYILKCINTSDSEDKKMYSNILRAQLTNYQLALLFYDCLSDFGRDHFKELAEKYEIFKYLPDELLIKREHRKLVKEPDKNL